MEVQQMKLMNNLPNNLQDKKGEFCKSKYK